jgi:hypothetical protein
MEALQLESRQRLGMVAFGVRAMLYLLKLVLLPIAPDSSSIRRCSGHCSALQAEWTPLSELA